MREAFERFIAETSLETYYAVRDLLAAHPRFNPYSEELRHLNALCEARRFEEMFKVMPTMLPNCLLSPSFHIFASIAARELEDAIAAEAETVVARKCMDSLLNTGDGTQERPYHVVRIEDEYDVMAFCGRESTGQSLVEEGGRFFDVLDGADGGRTWFDVTIPRTYLERVF